jgi:radical SAM protein with 4Fe4S-binding SPASM domain
MSVKDALVRAAARLEVPVDTTIELIPRCNLRCVHCYVEESKANLLTPSVLRNLIDELADAGSFGLTFTGGEPGIRTDLFELIAYARRRRFSVTLLSNGTMWGPSDWDRLAELAVSKIRLSLYAVEAAVHDAVTGVAGSHARTMATLEGLLARHVPVSVACPVLDLNAGSVAALADLAAHLDIAFGIDGNLALTETGGTNPKKHLASQQQLTEAYRAAGAADPQLRPDGPLHRPDARARPCNVGESAAFIDCTGNIRPCAKWPDVAGNILRGRFLDVWRKSPVFRRARSITYEELTECRTCDQAVACRPCVAMNLKEEGTPGRAAACLCTNVAAKAAAHRVSVESN